MMKQTKPNHPDHSPTDSTTDKTKRIAIPKVSDEVFLEVSNSLDADGTDWTQAASEELMHVPESLVDSPANTLADILNDPEAGK